MTVSRAWCASLGVLGAALFCGTEEPQLPANQQTGLRLACNLCKQPPLHQWLQTHNAALMDRFAPCCSSTNKPVRLGFATFMLNLAVFFSTAAMTDTEGQAHVCLHCFCALTHCPCFLPASLSPHPVMSVACLRDRWVCQQRCMQYSTSVYQKQHFCELHSVVQFTACSIAEMALCTSSIAYLLSYLLQPICLPDT